MGLSNILRGVGHGVASVGRAVQTASRRLDGPVPPAAPQAQVGPPAPGYQGPVPDATNPALGEGAPAAPASKGFMLPDLGPAPDPNAPDFQGEEGKKKYEAAVQDYTHKQDIHQAFTDLDKVYSQMDPHRDYEGEYREAVKMQKEHEKSRPEGSPLARFALALGDYNPAVQQSGRSNLDTYNKGIEGDIAQSDKSFSQRMMLRSKMHEAAAADAEAKGNWKKALAEQEKLALLKLDEQKREHGNKMEEIGAAQQGATERARIRRDALENTAKIRARAIGGAHSLSGTFMSQFEKEAAKAVAKLLGPRDLTKEYSPADLDTITNYLENLSEMFHDQQYGDGSADTHLSTHPNKRRQPKVKEQF